MNTQKGTDRNLERREEEAGTSSYLWRLSPSTTYNRHSRELVVHGKVHVLTTAAAVLLCVLCDYGEQCVPSATLCKSIWNNDDHMKMRQLYNYISEIRKYLKPDTELYIITWYGGGGYTLCCKNQTPMP
jgi:DNA-binding response OmpR family regulator